MLLRAHYSLLAEILPQSPAVTAPSWREPFFSREVDCPQSGQDGRSIPFLVLFLHCQADLAEGQPFFFAPLGDEEQCPLIVNARHRGGIERRRFVLVSGRKDGHSFARQNRSLPIGG